MPIPLRLYAFNGGTVTMQGVRFVNPHGQEEIRDMADPNHCFLIQHPDGLFMWDTGLSDSLANLPDHTLEWGMFRFTVEQTLQSQLHQTGFAIESINLLAFSHLQIDHAGNACLFPNARILMQKLEYEIAFGPEAEKWGYIAKNIACLKEKDVQLFQGDLDVFGDGSVLLLSAPGHTPGHQVLFVDLPRTGPLLLSGDLYYDPRDPDQDWIPAWNIDLAQTLTTFKRLNLFRSERGAQWLINHSPLHRQQIPLAPVWME